ncbi:hypothetical protein [Thermococcus thermotolerans]|uniref:hypothetical protein n=1 Tax=Thermococcus thermotolerans TaxID=2969672 RepID=UPI002156F83B|nr:hypothetical protein [Thermococcus thermotolerans]
MNMMTKIIPIPFLVLAVAYGIYAGESLPVLVGVAGMAFYALSLKRGEETSIKLTGLVAMFSSILALWEGPLRYLGGVGIVLLAILEVSIRIRTHLSSSPEVDGDGLS